jgi:hypothetical protein
MIAQNIEHAAVLAGHKARFVSTADLLFDHDLSSGRQPTVAETA